ncbi:hypothetical protein DRO54_05490 [Candidatus Bathyarchaeota archaeon]|nr:MAG: hypothetical protein DRO54_05490 [Candidatus Bathyarchaeota archaeon]RLI55403.1 MAG: hypothetical protein DRP09_09910 [Candidatus Thorarchaeota archaeon]
MSELDILVGKPMTKNIGGVELTLHPLTLEDFDVAVQAASDDDQVRAKGIIALVKRTLEKSYPNEKNLMKKIGLRYMADLVTFCLEVNGLSGETTPLEKGGDQQMKSDSQG